jgi:hypothetical protein
MFFMQKKRNGKQREAKEESYSKGFEDETLGD